MALGVSAWPWRSGRGPRPNGPFLVEPYVQLGDAPVASSAEGVEVLWQTADRDGAWSVEAQRAIGGAWEPAEVPKVRRVALPATEPYRLFRATIAGLTPGGEFAYRLKRDGMPVFEARARARKGAGQPHRFVVFGDGAADTPGQRAVADQAYRARPDFLFIAGDLVYYKGRTAEYLDRFFPFYNAEKSSASAGAPLLRSTLTLVAPGNHDLTERDFDRVPDALAYYLFWSLPGNGPIVAAGSPNSPILQGAPDRQKAFLEAAGSAYPRTANYSFDFGDAHWTVLDTNPYVDWTDPALRAWLERDLASAQAAAWRFVAFHHPPFHSSKAHADDQRSRVLVDLFEKGNVDLVISGHIHNYQRSYPLHFVAEPARDGRLVDQNGHVQGRWTLDTTFDGLKNTHPDGIIYLVTGGGGARLYDNHWFEDGSREPFTAKFIASTHSLTVVDVTPAQLTVRQVSAAGDELDRFVVTRGLSGRMGQRIEDPPAP
jgi:3',5'-cyclic AMP phosphodiesterase CpdA